ncbi:MAG: sugar phosphate isomerase/epimerase [Fimbriimonadales bacterium]|nr:sugar phosphate isomerase/epimerase [Fimbriimonadales bacterium]
MGSGPFAWVTGFVDEAAAEAAEQISLAVRLGLRGVDVRTVGGKNVLALSDDEARAYRDLAEAAGLTVQTVSSPVNKVPLTQANREEERRKLRRAIELAGLLGTRRIRIFSPSVGDQCDERDWPAVREWMAEQVAMARDADILLLHENDARFYGAFPEGSRRLLEEFGCAHFRAAFDFANTVLIGFRPMRDWFPWLLPHLDTLHIKDAVESEGRVVPAGEGDGQMEETFRWLLAQGWDGPLTLEPHLTVAGPFGGHTGPELFETAVRSLRSLLARVCAREG